MYSVTWNTCPQRLLRVWNACDKFITSIALADTRRLVPLPLDEETLKHWSATTAVRLPRYNVETQSILPPSVLRPNSWE